jgi:hypothetical protein
MKPFSSALTLAVFLSGWNIRATGQTVLPSAEPGELPGDRPYEIVWASRQEPAAPTLTFDELTGWRMETKEGAQATLQPSRAQNIWQRPVGRLRYRGEGKSEGKPQIKLLPPLPLLLPTGADSVELWLYGNRWSWENPPGTPPLRIALHLRDDQGQSHTISMGDVRWQEWWLMHHKLPSHLTHPLWLQSLEITGGWQPEWREVFFDSVRFYQEDLTPLQFQSRPKRNLRLSEGQSLGANIGRGRLPFPVRPETILPMHWEKHYRTWMHAESNCFVFHYKGSDGHITYRFDPELGLSGLSASYQSNALCRSLLADAGIKPAAEASRIKPAYQVLKREGGLVRLAYTDGTEMHLRLWRKTLVLDVINRSSQASELGFGQMEGVTEPRVIWAPFLTFGNGPHPSVLLSRAGPHPVFTSIWLDWYRSNGSELYAAEEATTNTARINGGVRYHPRTDGKRNPMFERLFITVSPKFEETLPSVPNPIGLHARDAIDRLWQESWGPDNYEQQMRRSRMLRAYGIERLIQCNHEITWRDAGESFTLRTRAAPRRGGDTALQRYVSHQQSLGWLAGLYSNYTDYAPVNEFWSPDGVQRQSDGNWRAAWPRCYAEKPLKAVEFDALLAPQIKRKFSPNSAYTDVHTAVAPWHYTDFDARVPGAATFAQTFYAYGELLRHDSQVYAGPVFSEGSYHWLYAGLADGNYALAYDGRPLALAPLLPVFDLYQIHPKECDIGMGWTANFCDAIPGWQNPENIDGAIDRFLLHTLAYGHIGWLVEETHGIQRACRSYYMIQQVQSRYGLQAPTRVAYWDGQRLISVSEALVRDLPRVRRQLYVEYPSGLQLWLNDHPSENWTVASPDTNLWDSSLVLPPAGWAAFSHDRKLFSISGLKGARRIDYLRSPAYTFLDGRSHELSVPEASAQGSLVVMPREKNRLEIIRIMGAGPMWIRRPYGIRGVCVSCEAFDDAGKTLGNATITGSNLETRIEPVARAIRYSLAFTRLPNHRSP